MLLSVEKNYKLKELVSHNVMKLVYDIYITYQIISYSVLFVARGYTQVGSMLTSIAMSNTLAYYTLQLIVLL